MRYSLILEKCVGDSFSCSQVSLLLVYLLGWKQLQGFSQICSTLPKYLFQFYFLCCDKMSWPQAIYGKGCLLADSSECSPSLCDSGMSLLQLVTCHPESKVERNRYSHAHTLTQWCVHTVSYLVFSLYIIIFSYEYLCPSICRALYRVHRKQNRVINALGLKLQVIMSHVGAGNQTWVHYESSKLCK